MEITMNRIKDFFYNKNDIIIAIIILVAAAFLIFNRVEALMDYPAKLAEERAAESEVKTTQEAEKKE